MHMKCVIHMYVRTRVLLPIKQHVIVAVIHAEIKDCSMIWTVKAHTGRAVLIIYTISRVTPCCSHV